MSTFEGGGRPGTIVRSDIDREGGANPTVQRVLLDFHRGNTTGHGRKLPAAVTGLPATWVSLGLNNQCTEQLTMDWGNRGVLLGSSNVERNNPVRPKGPRGGFWVPMGLPRGPWEGGSPSLFYPKKAHGFV